LSWFANASGYARDEILHFVQDDNAEWYGVAGIISQARIIPLRRLRASTNSVQDGKGEWSAFLTHFR
jgi:hypothetical protein